MLHVRQRQAGFFERLHAHLALAVVTQTRRFKNAGQVRAQIDIQITRIADGQKRCGIQPAIADKGLFGDAVLRNGHAFARRADRNALLRQPAHAVGVDVFKFGGDGGAGSGQFGQRVHIGIRLRQMHVGKIRRGRVGIGIEHGHLVTHGLGGYGKHAAKLPAPQNTQHGGWQNRLVDHQNQSFLCLALTICNCA